ncbi:MAG: STAS domain-containing protein [Phycisphaerales bacterium]|nr:STAS domain-containing protein [Phycisphaerales bacterium]
MDDVVKEVRADKGIVTVMAHGEITLDKSPAFHKAMLDLLESPPQHLIVDLGEVTHIDSAGVGTLVDVFRKMRGARGKMSLVRMTPRVRGVFEVTRLDKFFPIYSTEQEARAS